MDATASHPLDLHYSKLHFMLESANVNESIFIPKDVVHCIFNKEATPLEIIEVQTGDQVSEDDIYRIDDPYKR